VTSVRDGVFPRPAPQPVGERISCQCLPELDQTLPQVLVEPTSADFQEQLNGTTHLEPMIVVW
jgi:hypothetical protein